MSKKTKHNLTGIMWLFILAVAAACIGLLYAICPEFALIIIFCVVVFVGGVYALYRTVG